MLEARYRKVLEVRFDLEDGERVEVSLAGMDEEEEEGEYAPVVVEM